MVIVCTMPRVRVAAVDTPRPQTPGTDRDAVSDLFDGQQSRRGSDRM
jgi:hypothetical protein